MSTKMKMCLFGHSDSTTTRRKEQLDSSAPDRFDFSLYFCFFPELSVSEVRSVDANKVSLFFCTHSTPPPPPNPPHLLGLFWGFFVTL